MLAVELRPEERRRTLEDLIRPAQLAHLLLQLTEPFASAVLTPGAAPSSISACLTQVRTDSTP